MTVGSLRVTRGQLAEIIDHCRRDAPQEACGILGGKNGAVSRVFPMTNVERSTARYLMDPREQFEVMGQIWERGEDLVGIYHSHPVSPAYPSATDVEMAFYPESFYVIVSLATPEPEVRAFRILDGEIARAEIEILEEERTLKW